MIFSNESLSISFTNISHSTISNPMKVFGSAIYTPTLNMQSSYIEYNNADSTNNCTGAVYILSDCSITNSTLSYNLCSNSLPSTSYGGALYSLKSNVLLNKVLFDSNRATYGGAIFIYDLNDNDDLYSNFADVIMVNNNAYANGGAIFILNFQDVTVVNCSLLFQSINNTAVEGGDDCGSSISNLDFNPKPFVSAVYSGLEFSVSLSLFNCFGEIAISNAYYIIINSSSILYTGSQTTAYQNQYGFFSYNSLQLFTNQSTEELTFTALPQLPSNPTYQLVWNVTIEECGPLTTPSFTLYNLPTCVQCDLAQYNFGNNNNECNDCPYVPSFSTSPSQCIELDPITHLNFQIKEGFWPDQFTNPSELFACPLKNSCNSINCTTLPSLTTPSQWNISCYTSDSQCSEGYEGRLCSQCVCSSVKHCWYQSEGVCTECYASSHSHDNSISIKSIILTILFFIAFAVFAVIAFFIPKTTLVSVIIGLVIVSILAYIGVFSWYYSGLLLVVMVLYFISDRKFPVGVLKCLFFYLQIITSIVDINAWPYQLQGLVKTFALANLDISFLACFWPSVLSNPLNLFILFNLIVPIVAILMLITVFLELTVQRLRFVTSLRSSFDSLLLRSRSLLYSYSKKIANEKKYIAKTIQNDSDDNIIASDSDSDIAPLLVHSQNFSNEIQLKQKSILEKFIPKMYRIVLILIGASYFPVAIMTFSVVQCENGYMKEYMWISCSSHDFYLFLLIGILIFVFYIISYPLLLLLKLISIRRRLLRGEYSIEKFQSVLEGYRKEVFYFEVIYILEKLSIALALTMLPENRLTQILVITVTIVMSMLAQYILRPYHFKQLNSVVFISQCVIIFSYIFNIVYQMYGNGDTYTEYLLVLSWIISLFNSVILMLFLLLLILPKLRLFFLFTPKKSNLLSLLYDDNAEKDDNGGL